MLCKVFGACRRAELSNEAVREVERDEVHTRYWRNDARDRFRDIVFKEDTERVHKLITECTGSADFERNAAEDAAGLEGGGKHAQLAAALAPNVGDRKRLCCEQHGTCY